MKTTIDPANSPITVVALVICEIDLSQIAILEYHKSQNESKKVRSCCSEFGDFSKYVAATTKKYLRKVSEI